MPGEDYDSTGIESFHIPNFTFSTGEKLDIKVAYRSFNPTATDAVLIPTCFGGLVNSTFNPVLAAGVLKDYHVIVVAMLGNGESSSPSNTPSFPKTLRYEDCINAQYKLVTEHLGLKSLYAVIGFSMGGQQAYYWGAMHGASANPFVKAIVPICGSAKTSGHNIAFLDGPIGALQASTDYANGEYKAKGIQPTNGLRAFGQAYAAWLQSPEWYEQDLWKEWGSKSLEAHLRPWEHGGESMYVKNAWDPEDLLALARMWQAADIGTVGPEGKAHGDVKTALGAIQVKVLVMPARTDQYFRWEASEKEVKHLKKGIFAPIETVWGHVAGGGANKADSEWMDKRIAQFFSESS